MQTLRSIGEDALIQRITRLIPPNSDPKAGPGDDCAAIDLDPAYPFLQLLKTDALVSSIHFLPDADACAVGWKAIARVVSDFAAMGGHPEQFLVTLALPPETAVSWVENLYRGIADCLAKFGGILAGGETSSTPAQSASVISIAATGRVQREHLVLRSTAHPGDSIMVSGCLGGSIAGKHLHFTPRLMEASWLVRHFKPTAMMDLSDGLAMDLPRLATASGCGFQLDETALPLTPGCTVAQAIGDGEDYEILFAISPDRVPALLNAWRLKFPDLALTHIGQLTEMGSNPRLAGGWQHFATAIS